MSIRYFFVIALSIFAADCTIEDYRFISEINGYLKFHRFPEKWQNARAKCFMEGGVLASPVDANELTDMTGIIQKRNLGTPKMVYTGIHATYSNRDFTTVTGVAISKMDVTWREGKPNNYDDKQNCLIMTESGELEDVDCDTTHPFFCYKSIQQMDAHKCGPEYTKSDYKHNNYTGSCYKFHKEGKSWSKAFSTCLAEDAYLAIINSDTESAVISQVFNKHPEFTIPGDFHKDAASIGSTMWKEVGEWVQGTTLDKAGFSTFNDGEPNNVGGNEFCGSVWRNGKLNDHYCDRLLTFICEKSPGNDNDDIDKF